MVSVVDFEQINVCWTVLLLPSKLTCSISKIYIIDNAAGHSEENLLVSINSRINSNGN